MLSISNIKLEIHNIGELMDKKETLELTRVAFLGSAIIVFIIGLLLVIDSNFDNDLALLALVAMAVLNANFFYHTGQTKKDGDERLSMVANRAMANSWYLTLTTILVLLVIEGFLDLGIGATQMLGVGIIVMIASMTLFNEVLAHRGEVPL
jgi:hypothetical protein